MGSCVEDNIAWAVRLLSPGTGRQTEVRLNQCIVESPWELDYMAYLFAHIGIDKVVGGVASCIVEALIVGEDDKRFNVSDV